MTEELLNRFKLALEASDNFSADQIKFILYLLCREANMLKHTAYDTEINVDLGILGC